MTSTIYIYKWIYINKLFHKWIYRSLPIIYQHCNVMKNRKIQASFHSVENCSMNDFWFINVLIFSLILWLVPSYPGCRVDEEIWINNTKNWTVDNVWSTSECYEYRKPNKKTLQEMLFNLTLLESIVKWVKNFTKIIEKWRISF